MPLLQAQISRGDLNSKPHHDTCQLSFPSGAGHVGIFVDTHTAFLFCENPFYVELGLGIVIVWAWHHLEE
jgi:hypothetical protein